MEKFLRCVSRNILSITSVGDDRITQSAAQRSIGIFKVVGGRHVASEMEGYNKVFSSSHFGFFKCIVSRIALDAIMIDARNFEIFKGN